MDTNLRDPATPSPGDIAKTRFPLVPRAKPVCRPLDERVATVRHLTDLAQQRTAESLTRAAEAHNLAALIASDCGMPELARGLCWRQFDAFNGTGPHDAATAKLALQPLINLGRLLIRDGDGTAAYQLLETLFNALKSQSKVVVDRRTVNFANLVSDADDHREVVRWLWSVLLADGTRALTRAGRWNQALQHARQHKGIGERLFDGRQVAILAHCAGNAHDDAHKALAATITATTWEQAVAACLKVICLKWSDQAAASATTGMVDQYLALESAPEHVIFHVRLGLCVAELSDDEHHTLPVTRNIERSALDAEDAYAANEVLSHHRLLPLTTEASQALTQFARLSGIGRGTMPDGLQDDLIASARASERSIVDALGKSAVGGQPDEAV